MNGALIALIVFIVLLIILLTIFLIFYNKGVYKPYSPPTIDSSAMSQIYQINSPWGWSEGATSAPVPGTTGDCNIYTFVAKNSYTPANITFNDLKTCQTNNTCVGSNLITPNYSMCIDEDQVFATQRQHICQGNTGLTINNTTTDQAATITSGKCLQQNGNLANPGDIEIYYQRCAPIDNKVLTKVGTVTTSTVKGGTNNFKCPGSLSIIAFNVEQGKLGPSIFNNAVCMSTPKYNLEISYIKQNATVITPPVVITTNTDITGTPTIISKPITLPGTTTSGTTTPGSTTSPITPSVIPSTSSTQLSTDTIIESAVFTNLTPLTQEKCDIQASYNNYPSQLFRIERASYDGVKFTTDPKGIFARIIHRPSNYLVSPSSNLETGGTTATDTYSGSTLGLTPIGKTVLTSGYWWVLVPALVSPLQTPTYIANTPTITPSSGTLTDKQKAKYGIPIDTPVPGQASSLHLNSFPQIVYVNNPNLVPSISDPTKIWNFVISKFSIQIESTQSKVVDSNGLKPMIPTVGGILKMGLYLVYDPANYNYEGKEKINSTQYLDYAILPLIMTDPSSYTFY